MVAIQTSVIVFQKWLECTTIHQQFWLNKVIEAEYRCQTSNVPRDFLKASHKGFG